MGCISGQAADIFSCQHFLPGSDFFLMRHIFPIALATFAAAMFLSGCGKPEIAPIVDKEGRVEKGGALPASGMGSRLKNEQSAFLRRHANDPMEWHPWGDEAFARAKKENKPVLVAVGYASCPWSQKMTEESYTNAKTARIANKHFVCVLVDREERPDINTALLSYVFWKSSGSQSGWPLHVWLTPDGLPMEKAVYIPPVSTGNSPGWGLLLENTASRWLKDPAHEAKVALKDANEFKRNYRIRWQGPMMEGDVSSKVAKAFLGKSEDDQLNEILTASSDWLQNAVSHLPAAKLEKLWKRMTPEQSSGLVARLRGMPAAVLFAKLSGPTRVAALQQYLAEVRKDSFAKLRSTFDPSNGGFGPPPRFAPHQSLEFLLNYAVRHRGSQFGADKEAVDMVRQTLEKSLRGGIFDHLAGGWHRYSTDVYWMVPQFEKMIYDQGYMACALVAAYQVLGDQTWARAAVETLGYASAELSHPQGGFYCAEGSSSAGATDGSAAMVEGAHYIWSEADFKTAAGDKTPLLSAVFGIEERGNLPMDSSMRNRLGNTNVLAIRQTPEDAGKALGVSAAAGRALYDEGRKRLLEVRRKRPRPMLDDKVLTSWSGIALSGFARTGFALADESLVNRGIKAADFILTKLRSKDGALLHAYLDGPSPLPGYSEDYATFVGALIDLYEATGEVRWLTSAVELQDRQIKDLWDKEDGGFFDGPETPHLFFRMKSMDESSEISAGSSSLINLVLLSVSLNNADYRDKGRRVVERFGSQAAFLPTAFYRFLRAAGVLGDSSRQIVISGAPDAPGRKELIAELRKVFRPGVPLLYMDGGEGEKFLTAKVPDLSALAGQPGKATVHLCSAFKPENSISDPKELAAALKATYAWP